MKSKRLKKARLATSSFIAGLLAVAPTLHADKLSDSLKYGVKGNIGMSGREGDDKPSIIATDFSLGLELAIKDLRVKTILNAAEGLKRNLMLDGQNATSGFDEERMVEEANITYDVTNNGTLIATIQAGKTQLPMDQGVSMVPETQDKLRDTRTIRQIMAVRIAVNPEVLGAFQKVVKLSSIETFVSENRNQNFDLNISPGKSGAGVTIKKQLCKTIEASATYATFEQELTDREHRANFGLAYHSTDGKTKVYGSFTYMNNNPDFADSDYIIEGGASYKVGPGHAGVVANHINNEHTRAYATYLVPINEHLAVMPYIAYEWADKNGAKDAVLGGVELQASWENDLQSRELTPQAKARSEARKRR